MPISGGVSQDSSDYFDDDDPAFLAALSSAVLPGDLPIQTAENGKNNGSTKDAGKKSGQFHELEHPPSTQPSLKRRWNEMIDDLDNEKDQLKPQDDTYGATHFGGFGDYMKKKRAKLQIQNAEMDTKKAGIFKGIAIYVNGWTRPSVQELRQLIMDNGGIFRAYLDRKALVTHIITCSLTPAKRKEFQNMKVVRPEWLVESVQRGVLLPWRDYVFERDAGIDESQGKKNQPRFPAQQNHFPNAQPPSDFKIAAPSTTRQAGVMSKPNPPAGVGPSVVRPNISKPNFLPPPRKSTAVDPLYTTDPLTKADAARVPGYAADKSNPNAQRAMANPEWRKAHTSASSGFIEGYYKNSRLHHLSTWKAELKELVQKAQEHAEGPTNEGHTGKIESETADEVSMRGIALQMRSPNAKGKWKGKGKAVANEERVIMHCDFDCFFVSAGLVSRPELKGKPVVVCHSQGGTGGMSSTSEIASSSYEARKFGIKNGMSLQQARQLCPGIITIPYEFQRYKDFSLLFYTVLMSHADDLQAVSVDEALIDVSMKVSHLRGQDRYVDDPEAVPKDLAELIRAEVRRETTCEISIGISHNIQLARLATRRAKPGGSFYLTPDLVTSFLSPLDISDLHGFGWSTKQKAQEKLGTTILGELAKKSKGVLIDAVGKATGETLYNAIRGIDDKKLESDKPRKSVSCEINYGIRFENSEQAETFVRQMAVEIKKRLDAIEMVGRSITIKVMKRDPTAPVEPPKFLGHGACDVFNKQSQLIGPGSRATSDDKIIGDQAWKLLKAFHFDPKELRGIGIQVQKLESANAAHNVPGGQQVLDFTAQSDSISHSEYYIGDHDGPSKPRIPPQKPRSNFGVPRLVTKPLPVIPDPVKPPKNAFDPDSFSQIDRSVFDLLPRDVQQELKNEYKRRIESPSKPPDPVPVGVGPPPPVKKVSFAFPEPRKGEDLYGRKQYIPGQRLTFQELARKLAAEGRAALDGHGDKKSALYSWAMKKRKRKRNIKITEKKLREFNIDPEVFFALPIKIQSEQLARARLLKNKGYIPKVSSQRKVLKAKKLELPPDFVPWIPPAPVARHPPPPVIRQRGKEKGEKLAFTETDDIQRVVEDWVKTYSRWEPRDTDIAFLQKWVVASVDRKIATDVGVERAVAVMKWWMILLRRLFPAQENMTLEDIEATDLEDRNLVGEAWWIAFDTVLEAMEVITRKRFGGRLIFR